MVHKPITYNEAIRILVEAIVNPDVTKQDEYREAVYLAIEAIEFKKYHDDDRK